MTGRQALGRGLGALIPTAGTVAGPAAAAAQAAKQRTVPERRLPLGEVYHAPETPEDDEAQQDGPFFTPSSIVADEVPGAHFAELPVDSITPNQRQPRDHFDEEAMEELVHSIREVGLLQPIVVRPIGPSAAGKYELIMGERRWRATQQAGLERIPAIVRETEDDRMLLDALLENLHRSQLNPLEEAAAYDQLLKDFSCTHDQLADRIGRSRPYVSNTLRLLKLPYKVQLRVAGGLLSAGHARLLLALDSEDEQLKLAERINNEQMSVRDVEALLTARRPDAKQRTQRRVRAGSRVSPVLDQFASRLSDRLETRVKVELGSQRGRIVVDFAAMEDLDRIMKVLLPNAGTTADGDSED
ncbi:MAG TPA: ParB/RepB/Spo0J family partition protein [Actinocrinis sp.]|jgi:ParB family chromosome partitioning protein